MRADSLVGRIIAVLSRRTPELRSPVSERRGARVAEALALLAPHRFEHFALPAPPVRSALTWDGNSQGKGRLAEENEPNV